MSSEHYNQGEYKKMKPFRQQYFRAFTDHKTLDFMFEQMKLIALQNPQVSGGNL